MRAASCADNIIVGTNCGPRVNSKLAADGKQTHILERYWKERGARDTTAPQPLRETPLASPTVSFKAGRPGQGHTRNRSVSDGTALIPPGHRLSTYHPAWSLTKLLETFGPLIFPIHRAAMLRKRILISTHAPVHEACNFGPQPPPLRLVACEPANNAVQCTIYQFSPTFPFPSPILSTPQPQSSDLNPYSRSVSTTYPR